MNEDVAQIVYGVGLPAIAGLAAGFFVPRREEPSWRAGPRSLVLPTVVAVAAVGSFVALHGWPREQWQSMTWVALPGFAAAALMLAARQSRWIPLLAIAAAVGAAACTWPVIAREAWGIRLIGPVIAVVVAMSVETQARRRPGAFLPISLGFALGGVAAIVLLSGFLKLAIPVAAAGFAVGCAGLVGLFRRDVDIAGGTALVASPILAMAPLVAWLYMTDEMNPAAFVLPAVAPLALWVGELPFIARRSRWIADPIRLTCVVLVIGIGVALTFVGESETETDDPYADMYGLVLDR